MSFVTPAPQALRCAWRETKTSCTYRLRTMVWVSIRRLCKSELHVPLLSDCLACRNALTLPAELSRSIHAFQKEQRFGSHFRCCPSSDLLCSWTMRVIAISVASFGFDREGCGSLFWINQQRSLAASSVSRSKP